MDRRRSSNTTWSESLVRRDRRQALLGQRGGVIWLTGLSGSGKSTIGRELERRLVEHGRFAYLLDGDNVRQGLCGDLGFSPTDRTENIRRVGEVGRLFADAGAIAIAAFISPYRVDRALARRLCDDLPFIEVFLSPALSCCETRDPKGLYARARAGAIRDFTGIDAPYEAPSDPEIRLDTAACSLDRACDVITDYLQRHGMLAGRAEPVPPEVV